MKTTIRKWFEEEDVTPLVLSMPKTAPNEYWLQRWVNLPSGTWAWADVPAVILDEPFDSGFGSQDVPSFHAWTKDRIYYVHEYDGAVSLAWVPLNPPGLTIPPPMIDYSKSEQVISKRGQDELKALEDAGRAVIRAVDEYGSGFDSFSRSNFWPSIYALLAALEGRAS